MGPLISSRPQMWISTGNLLTGGVDETRFVEILEWSKAEGGKCGVQHCDKISPFAATHTLVITARHPCCSALASEFSSEVRHYPVGDLLKACVHHYSQTFDSTAPSRGRFCDFACSLNSASTKAEISSQRNRANSSCCVGKSRSWFV